MTDMVMTEETPAATADAQDGSVTAPTEVPAARDEGHEAALALARVAAQAADDKKADDVAILDLAGLSDVSDALVICTGSNARLADSVIDEVEERVRAATGTEPLAIEGRREGRWVLIDYGSVVVHVFTPEARDFYRLERLWGDAPRIPLA